MQSDRKWIYLSYIAATLLVAWVVNKTLVLAMGYARIRNPVLWGIFTPAGLVSLFGCGLYALYYFRQERVNAFTTEVMAELRKVAWPTRKLASGSTVVVIVCVVIMAVALGLMDTLCAWVIRKMIGA